MLATSNKVSPLIQHMLAIYVSSYIQSTRIRENLGVLRYYNYREVS